MKVLTIRQPWATLIVEGYKRFEFRSWKTNYRGDILIHAGKGIDKEAMERLKKYLPNDIPLGKIIGFVPIPPIYIVVILGVAFLYCMLASFVKKLYIKKYGEWL